MLKELFDMNFDLIKRTHLISNYQFNVLTIQVARFEIKSIDLLSNMPGIII